MASQTIADALVLGILEGLTEFIPVSSTGHILLAGHFLGFESTGKAFEVLIQLGAILAILSAYFGRLWKLLVDLPRDARTRRFVLGILIAFLPAAVIGALGARLHQDRAVRNAEADLHHADPRRRRAAVGRPLGAHAEIPRHHGFPAAGRARHRPVPVPGADPRHVALGRHHRRLAAARRRQALRGGVLVLSRHADHGRRLRLRPRARTATSCRRPTCRSSRPASSPPSWSR